MTELKAPNLLTHPGLARPIRIAKGRLEELVKRAGSTPDKFVTQGALIFGVASFETMLLDILRYLLQCFPEKLSFTDTKIRKEDALNLQPRAALLRSRIESTLIALAYKRLPDLLSKAAVYLGIEELDEALCDELTEVKETRNLLLHNDLEVNSLYLEKAGPKRRAERVGRTLKVDEAYLASALDSLARAVEHFEVEVSAKYAAYTRIAAIRRLWEWCFSSPVMKFEDYWVVDESEDKVVRYTFQHESVGLATSEEIMLGVWRTLFHGDSHLDKFNMRLLDEGNQARVVFLLSIDSEFDLY